MSAARLPRLRTDWFRVLVDLKHNGYPHSRAGSMIGAPLQTVLGWKEGSEPAHCYGHNLLELWCEVTGKTMAERPMIRD